ncbi:hypothetical protein ACRTDM_05190 [Shewanella algae]|uniref:phage tail fiber protein n=1 Tax=Shewanella algae TaxID=38313 RepID=UPI003D7ED913
MSWYRTGTVTVTNGSTTVTGSGTAWVANSRVGDAFVGPDGLTYEITNIASNTAISILPAYRSASGSGQSYSIIPVQGYTKNLADQAADLVNTYDKPWNVADDAADARSALGLGTAATRNAGESVGNVILVGGFGVGSISNSWELTEPGLEQTWARIATVSGAVNSRMSMFVTSASSGYSPGQDSNSGIGILSLTIANQKTTNTGLIGKYTHDSSSPSVLDIRVLTNDGGNTFEVWFLVPLYSHLIGHAFGTMTIINNRIYQQSDPGGRPLPIYTFLYTGNTTVDSNGFIKQASPIVKLFSDKVEFNSESVQQEISIAVNGIGDYTVIGTTGFSQEGWYIETPKDSNGNIKCFVEYEQIAQSDGTFTINVKTFEPDYSEGPAKAGSPKHIPEGRWIDIRLQPLPASEQGDQVGNNGEN